MANQSAINRISLVAVLCCQGFIAPVTYASVLYSVDFQPEAEPGQSAQLTLSMPPQVRSARIYYRITGDRQFGYMDLSVSTENLDVELPAEAIARPGVEFFLEFKTLTGETLTDPADYPHYNPYRISVESAPAPRFELLSPDPGATVEDDMLDLRLRFEGVAMPLDLTVFLDGRDITEAAQIGSEGVMYKEERLAVGPHTVEVTGVGPAGEALRESWSFNVADLNPTPSTKLNAHGGLGINYGVPVAQSHTSGDEQLSANMNLAFGLHAPAVDLSWQGINLQYVRGHPGDDYTLGSGFLLQANPWGQSLEYGDITVRESRLTAPSFARRGVQAKFNAFDGEIHVFDVQAETVSGFESGLSSGQQVYGIGVRRAFLPRGALQSSMVYITGENSGESGYNTASSAAPSKGDVLGIALEHGLNSGARISGEVAFSRFDSDIADSIDERRGMAGNVDVVGSLATLDLGLGYQYYHPDFASIANPSFTSDREGFSGRIGSSLGPANISLSLSRANDNVTDDPTKPVVISTASALALGWITDGGPSVNIAYGRSYQNSQDEPAGGTKVDNINKNLSTSATWSGTGWSAGSSVGYGNLEDTLARTNSVTRNYSLFGSFNPMQDMALSANAGLTQSEPALGTARDTWLFGITGNLPLWTPYGSSGFQISYTDDSSEDKTIKTNNLGLSWRLNLNIHELVKHWMDFGQEVLALSVNYSKLQDEVNPTNSSETYSVFLTINMHAPMKGSYGF